MRNSNEHITLEILLKSLNDDFDAVERAKIFETLKNYQPNDDALLGAKMLLEENNWDYKILKNAFTKTESKIDAIALAKPKRNNNYLKIAAVLIPFFLVTGYFIQDSKKSIDDFYTKDSGLPNLMSSEPKNDWNNLMQLYKTNQLDKAYLLSKKINESKKQNDTAMYYKAIIAYDLQKFDNANANFSNVKTNKKSVFYFDAEFRLGFSLLKLGKKLEAKRQFEKVKSNFESPYQSDAETILKEIFY